MVHDGSVDVPKSPGPRARSLTYESILEHVLVCLGKARDPPPSGCRDPQGKTNEDAKWTWCSSREQTTERVAGSLLLETVSEAMFLDAADDANHSGGEATAVDSPSRPTPSQGAGDAGMEVQQRGHANGPGRPLGTHGKRRDDDSARPRKQPSGADGAESESQCLSAGSERLRPGRGARRARP